MFSRLAAIFAALAVAASAYFLLTRDDAPPRKEGPGLALADPFAKTRALPAPAVERRPTEIVQHGERRIDDYAWLRVDNWREVLRDPALLADDVRAMLEAENAYYEEATAALQPLRETLFAEMRGRIKEDDSTVPAPDGPWRYWTKFREGGEYPIYMRAPREGGPEEIVFDGDAEKGESRYFRIGSVAPSPDHALAAIAIDRVGSEYYTIRVRDLATGEDLPGAIASASGSGAVWTADGRAFFYVERDDNQRPKRVKLHRLGDDPAQDRVVYEEEDDGFFVGVRRSLSRDFIFIESSSHTSGETRFLRADAPNAEPVLVEPRTADLEYTIEHRGDAFYILTNADGAVDFKVMTAPLAAPGRANWSEWIPYEAGVQITRIAAFAEHFVRMERRDALPRIVVSGYEDAAHEVAFEEAAYALGFSQGFEFATDTLRLFYESPSTPQQVYDYDMRARSRTLLKTQEVPSGHDSSLYVVERRDALAADGARIPVTILRLKTTPVDGTAPVLLYGYGSYGAAISASFSTINLSLVDRGVIYATADVRGSSARGRQWYLDGKRDKKMNSFTDFNAAAEMLVAGKYAAPGRIAIFGGSAGGLLVGAAVNMRPDLYAGVIAAVPFVDVINTISDASLPLTPPEWDEWGNPIESAEEYGWIRAYSPYENIERAHYPPILATGGIADFRVTYWEPAKWIARLRAEALGGPFFLRMNMGAGHGGSAARFERLEERAHLFAFALKALGADGVAPVAHGGANSAEDSGG